MESQASAFDTSEILATFLASTPLLSESLRLCAAANSDPSSGFKIDQRDGVGYLAFTGVLTLTGSFADHYTWAHMVPLGSAGEGVFGPLVGPAVEGESPPMVHAGLMQLFLPVLQSQSLINQISALIESCKSIVITGHSVGGSLASLTTLWLLSQLHLRQPSLSSSSPTFLCITFGSPLLGNKSLTRSILRERWTSNFCHVAAQHDIMPRLLFLCPAPTLLLLQQWQSATMGEPGGPALNESVMQMCDQVVASMKRWWSEDNEALFWPFGNYLLCSREGAICIDDATCVVKMLYYMIVSRSSYDDCVGDHVKYGEYVGRICLNYLKKKSFEHPGNCYEVGLAMALDSAGIGSQEPNASSSKECLVAARRLGLTPILNCAKLSISLSEVAPLRAQVEWFMARCDDSVQQLGYYDEFKFRGRSRMSDQVNLNRVKLSVFWDTVIEKLETNKLPHDFQKRDKWVNAFQFYKLLVEPLDIAEYYRENEHENKGHYLSNGRPRRYQISDRWWSERRARDGENRPRTRYASQTQDSCFWARLEEATEWLRCLQIKYEDKSVRREMEKKVDEFDAYARNLVERLEVSKDVVAANSSYTKWTEELRRVRSQLVYPIPS